MGTTKNKLYFRRDKNDIIIMSSPFGEWRINLENHSLEMFLESLEYWGVEYVDMDKAYDEGIGFFDKIKNKFYEYRQR